MKKRLHFLFVYLLALSLFVNLAVEKTLKQRSHGSAMLFGVQSTDIYIYISFSETGCSLFLLSLPFLTVSLLIAISYLLCSSCLLNFQRFKCKFRSMQIFWVSASSVFLKFSLYRCCSSLYN